MQNNMRSRMQPRYIKNKQEISKECSYCSFQKFRKRTPTFMVCEEIKALQDTKSRKLGIIYQMLHNRDMEASELIKVPKYLPG